MKISGWWINTWGNNKKLLDYAMINFDGQKYVCVLSMWNVNGVYGAKVKAQW